MRQDILLDSNNDLKIINGDFLFGESDQQHVELILSTSPNDWKENPIIGAALINNSGGNLNGSAKRNASVQLEADGYALDKIIESKNGLNVTARTI